MTTTSKPERTPRDKLLSTGDVSASLGMSSHEVRNFLARVPVAKKGKRGGNYYKLSDVNRAAASIAQVSTNEALPGTKEWHEVERIKRQVSKLDVELDNLRGKVIPRDKVRSSVTALCLEFRKHLDEMETKLPPLVAGLTPTEAQSRIADYNTAAREQLRNHEDNY